MLFTNGPVMKSNSLELDSVVVARDGAALTSPITLTLQGGEMVAIHGRNGSGKSTLLKTLAGLLPPFSGNIRVNGTWPSATRPLYIGHKRGLSPSLTVYDNVAFWAQASGFPELTAAAMHYFDLTDIADVVVETLSAGWQQRVALSRLITQQSLLWLLDEPTSNLDTHGISLLQTLIEARLEQGGMIAVATHYTLQGNGIKTININQIN